MNLFQVLSQHCSLHHLYNVFKPLAYDAQTHSTLDALQSFSFDPACLNPGSILALNLSREEMDKAFRMNERVFNYQLSANSQQNEEEIMNAPLYKDHFSQR